MKFPDPLIRGTLIKRYKRFLSDVELEDGSVVTAHCANSGSMLAVKEPGSEVWLSPARNPDRKLRYTWELIRVGKGLVGINTQLPNGLVAEAVENGVIAELAGYSSRRREVKYGKNSRIDLLLEGNGRPRCYVEVKSVTLSRPEQTSGQLTGLAEFPDAVTVRGAKHLVELADMVAEGARSVMVYLVQRQDCDRFSIAADIDPGYARGLETAMKQGVEVLCYACRLTTREIKVTGPIDLDL